MRILGIGLGNPSASERSELVERARAADVTYDHVGATLDAEESTRRKARIDTRDIGVGPGGFEMAVAALRDFVPQRDFGAEVEPADQVLKEDETVVFIVLRGPVHVVVPNRIVAVIDEPTRFAYAYGSLPGHPERGEESFTIELLDDGTVRATVRVLATEPSPAALVLNPAIAVVSRYAARRYLRSLEKAASA